MTFLAVPMNLTLELPAVMKALEGTDSTAVLLLETVNEKPPEGATPCERLMRISVVPPLVTVEGVAVRSPSAGCTATVPVEFSNTARPGLAPMIGRAMSDLPSPLKSPDTSVPPPTLESGGGTANMTGARNVPSPLPLRISITPRVPFARAIARSTKPSRLKSAIV